MILLDLLSSFNSVSFMGAFVRILLNFKLASNPAELNYS